MEPHEGHGMPALSDPLGYTWEEIEGMLGSVGSKAFSRFMNHQTVAIGDDGHTRYYPRDVHNFLHQGKLFWD